MPEQFHFLQPLWLLALIPLGLLLWRLRQAGRSDNPWLQLIDARLQPLLVVSQKHAGNRALLGLLGLGWLIATLALANPVWEKQPRPLYQTPTARVIVLDLSSSMLDRDLKPNRLARARFKIEDILARNEEGQTGLVVFAGDAFTVTPLTRDVDTIRALLKSLDPGLMPVQGSRADLGLEKAGQLLHQAGLAQGQILLLADGVADNQARKVARQLRKQGYRISVLGVGTKQAEPLTNAQGQLLRTTDGQPIVPALEEDALRAVAEAGGGRYRRFASGDADISALLDSTALSSSASPLQGDLQGQDWQSRGPWLVLLLLPLAALAFRRGWLLSLVLLVGVLSPPEPAMAAGWEDLWQRPDQQASQALQQQDYARASELARDPLLQGSAEYKRGNYEQALQAFSRARGTTADYNRGNALAKLGRYEEAIKAYEAALRASPDMADAQANKAAVEALLKKRDEARKARDKERGTRNEEKNGQQGGSEQQPRQARDEGQGTRNEEKNGQQGGSEQQPREARDKGQGTRDEEKTGQQQAGAQAQEANAREKAVQQQAGKEHETGDEEKNAFARAAEALEREQGKPGSAQAPGPDRSGQDQQQASPAQPAQDRQAQTARQEAGGRSARAEALSSEEQMAAEQWLRRIPDDPGGLLRRKFLYQYQQRAQRDGTGSRQPW